MEDGIIKMGDKQTHNSYKIFRSNFNNKLISDKRIIIIIVLLKPTYSHKIIITWRLQMQFRILYSLETITIN